MNSRTKFIIELKPPVNPASLDKYYARISTVVRLARRVSIASKPSGPALCGFESSLNLARYLLDENPNIDILFHLTCHDLNKVTIQTRLSSLRQLGITKILLITGDDYERPESKGRELFYESSAELVPDIVTRFGWFQTVAVGGYPGGDGRRSLSNAHECSRLSKSLLSGANAVYTQCVYDHTQFQDFARELKSSFPNVEVVPSLALFKDSQDLERISKLTRVRGQAFENLESTMGAIKYREGSQKQFSMAYLEQSCRKLLAHASSVDLCTFGQFDLAESLVTKFL